MKFYKYPSSELWPEICARPLQNNQQLIPAVTEILSSVQTNGDMALRDLSKKFDGVELSSIAVTATEIKEASGQVPPPLKAALKQAKKNIEAFHRSQKEAAKKIAPMSGITCWRESRPIEKVGLYIPGGSAPLFSTVLMLGLPARLAGCKEVILCTPCNKEQQVHPAVLYAASLCGIQKIFKTGGAQAIAAMAYGTQSIPAVFKIFGPGNQYVTMAKQLVQNRVAIDMPAGPSEVLVIADGTADPRFVAADLLAQAEHGPDSQVICITTQTGMVTKIEKAVTTQLKTLPRKDIAAKALEHSRIVVVKSLKEAVELSNFYAPEHLILACKTGSGLLKNITAAGSVFIGNHSPESAGDYASGTNHTLPTNGYAAAYSGVSLDSFYKKITFQQLTARGLKNIAATVTTMAEAEGLQAHSNAVKVRLSNL
ncbi:histidinol dehydrogenase [Niabella drilacis]|uniref:Histidinol dehydrogenase n=1 Tax=Niabella drilacis (strain DSM 25811 / CCM 8410 / CCUG 62505 / LMG 26954 / E90) TaxID=1285928 RepID=A0A1G6J0S6_NIADE|nr:histidinol dehydrogenase [Niabella drilacis]SDC12301.1 histidinol dehydrogenase [Niabella drilacis]